MALELEDQTGQIIGAAIEVHRELGPGFLESIYEEALALELASRRIPFQRQREVSVVYKGVEVGAHRLDLFVFGQIVVELKAVKVLKDVHFVVVRSYLCALGRDHGLLLNFSTPTLTIKRVSGNRDPAREIPGFLGS
ncbi:MAG: GxxExxY protein [Planctomycetes bacterium]|nr:GxxExxY protein [Planctomycetota bacterium]